MFHAVRTASISAARLLVFAAKPSGPGQRGTKRGRRRVAERRADLTRLGREQLVGENGGDEPGIISSATCAGANCLVIGAGNLADDVAEFFKVEFCGGGPHRDGSGAGNQRKLVVSHVCLDEFYVGGP